jgi:hypothetical protein
MTGADGTHIADSYRLITTLADHRAYPEALVRLCGGVCARWRSRVALQARSTPTRRDLYGLAGPFRPAVGDEPETTQTPSRAAPASSERLPLTRT